MASVIKPAKNKDKHADKRTHEPHLPHEERLDPRRKPEVKRKPMRLDAAPWAVNWIAGGWLVAMHIGAIAAFWCFTWQGLATLVVLHWLTGGIGICLGFHRLLTHSSFRTYKPVKWFLAIIGALAGEGPASSWVAHHRQHHAQSDQEGDPHSPLDGGWWSHMGWLAWTRPSKEHRVYLQRWAPDLMRDKVLQVIDMLFLPLHFALGATLFGIGYAFGGLPLATSLLVYGMFVRLVAVLHTTWFVNSASHIWGYRNYETTDESRNNWWVAIIAYGEGWHNNHHAYPRMAPHGHKWWEFDMTYTAIRVLRMTGLAWDVVDYKQRTLEDAH